MTLTLGIIGAGAIGSNVARLAVEHGLDVVIGNSRGPQSLAALIARLGASARAATARGAAEAADIVVLATPFGAYQDLPVEQIADKTVIDATTYYDGRDGKIPSILDQETTPAEFMQAFLPRARLVKLFSNITAAEIAVDARPLGAADRRALPITGDDPKANARVAALLENLGYDIVDAGPLSESWRYDPYTPASGAVVNAAQLRDLLAAATR